MLRPPAALLISLEVTAVNQDSTSESTTLHLFELMTFAHGDS